VPSHRGYIAAVCCTIASAPAVDYSPTPFDQATLTRESEMIRAARREDFLALRELEHAAGEPFRGLGMAEVADDEPLAVEELTAFQLAGHAWVCADTGDFPVAYLLMRVINDGAHIEQLSVHPSHARKGLGAALLRFADGCAAGHGLRTLTLTCHLRR